MACGHRVPRLKGTRGTMVGYGRGLYEVIVTEALAARLEDLEERLQVLRDNLRPAEAADRIALHLAQLIERAVAGVSDAQRVAVGVALARRLIAQIDDH